MRTERLYIFIVLFLTSSLAIAQGGKAFLKEGDSYRKEGQLKEALEKYDLAISVDPKLVKAYEARAQVNELLGEKGKVAVDRKQIAELEPAEAQHGANAAKAYLEVDSPAVARALCDKALAVDRKNMDALQTRIRACLVLHDLDCATKSSDDALALKGTTDTYYLHALVRTALRDYKTAESDLDRVLEWNHLFEPAYVAQAEVQLYLHDQYTGPTMQMRALEKAIDKCSTALQLNPQSTDALFWRSKAYAQQKDYSKAIDDISRCLALGRADKAVYHQRALYYNGFGQFQNAVNDLNQILLEDPKDVENLLLRSQCLEANLNMEGALKDLEVALKAMEGNSAYGAEDRKRIEAARVRIAEQVFEMNRESDPPRLTVLEPYSKESVAMVSASLSHLKVSGHILDKSLITSITVNGAEAQYDKEEKDPQFFTSIPWGPADKEINVQATDVYENLTSVVLRVERSEGIPPMVDITSPIASGRSVSISADKESLFVEGKISDGSLIRMIAVNGVNASYAPDQLNPDFSIKLDVKEKDKFTVHVEDQYGNSTDQAYSLVRRSEPVAVEKPGLVTTEKPEPVSMPATATRRDATWVIHIENTNYKNFPAIGTAGADASKMRKAFSTYSIAKTITKKNLTKDQLDRFFNVELRDLVRTNKVGTILVWYSGHGKSTGGKAYWIPVDARKDDIYSYFNYGSLKAQMQNYSESVDKTVVVSDAAGNDASFYELTR